MTFRRSASANEKLFVISVGGSLVIPDHIDTAFLKSFHTCILQYVRKGFRFILIVGGGKVSRRYQEAARSVVKLTNEDVDWLGIHATRLNAHLLRTIFRTDAYEKLITNKKKMTIHTKKPIIIGAGFRPGSSTDYGAVLLAKAHGAKTIINLSNIDYVYTKDPKRFKDAKKITTIDWKHFRKLVGNRWDPGANVPFDPVASRYAQKWGMRVIIARGTDMQNLKKILSGKPSRGTIVS